MGDPMRRLDSRQPDFDVRLGELLAFEAAQDPAIDAAVAAILADVRARGDAALTNALRRLSKARVTTVIITHRSAILHVVDKVLLLNNGAIRMYGPTADVLERHRRDQLPAQSAAEQVAEREPEKEAPPPEGGTLVQVDQA